MASIDAYWKLAASEPASKPALRISLLRLAPAATATIDRQSAQQRVLILLGIALLHVLLLLALRAAMQTQPLARGTATIPMQITIIERRVAPAAAKSIPVPPPVLRQRAVSIRQRFSPRPNALQAIAIPRAARVEPASPSALLYNRDGGLHVPDASIPSQPRDLLAHRNASFMLPGGARANSPDFHVRPDVSPQGVVDAAGKAISGLISGVAARPDGNGLVQVAPDRGLRTSGRDTDPCQDIAQDMMDADPDDAHAREQAEQRYQRSCEGH